MRYRLQNMSKLFINHVINAPKRLPGGNMQCYCRLLSSAPRETSSVFQKASPPKNIVPIKNYSDVSATATEPKSHHLQHRPHKKRLYEPFALPIEEGAFISLAYATAAEYDLEGLKKMLDEQKLYITGKLTWTDPPDILHAVASYQVGSEMRDLYIFREGAVVFWNCTEAEADNVLTLLKPFEKCRYSNDDILGEREVMVYKYQTRGKQCQLEEDWGFLLSAPRDDLNSTVFEKYTFSNAMIQSVKLGIWERSLARLADDVHSISKDMAAGNPMKINHRTATQLSGQLFDLRHQINLESDLLDTPDFYWEHHDLERLYGRTVSFFSISRRTQVLNKRLEHCVELMGSLNTWLTDKKHVRLEWMIIVLIMIEVGFETLHFIERYAL